MEKLTCAFKAFDEYNSKDPNLFQWNNETVPQELFLAKALYDWVLVLDPQAHDELLLASRCQHIGRWEIPRSSYPDGRDAYLKWRKDLALHHFSVAEYILRDCGYADDKINRVRQILLKMKIKQDPDVQTMENALCLVFLQYQFETFLLTLDDEKMINILFRSLLKMDAAGHAHALKLSFSERATALLTAALERLKR